MTAEEVDMFNEDTTAHKPQFLQPCWLQTLPPPQKKQEQKQKQTKKTQAQPQIHIMQPLSISQTADLQSFGIDVFNYSIL